MTQYRVRHSTSYSYMNSVVHAHHLAHMRPRTLPHQKVTRCEITTQPSSIAATHYLDYFGNHVDSFEVFGSHDMLQVVTSSDVEVNPNPISESLTLLDTSWENVVRKLDLDPSQLDVQEFRLASPVVRPFPSLRDFAVRTFVPGKPMIAAVLELNQRIHEEFKYDTTATDESTPLALFLEEKRGVCQDFAHLAVGCLRALGLSARYVSGYLETAPPPGRERLIGADASHAWVSAYVPDLGWLDFDPTNNVLPSERHITIGWGRDFSDVSPLKGVVLGGASQHVSVGVDVERIQHSAQQQQQQ
ncbi:MAG TPA: transglutaminase family protein [Polyangiaceae bacterium]|nr:transglutaminase family protein [Polyangiaceae bacterium]